MAEDVITLPPVDIGGEPGIGDPNRPHGPPDEGNPAPAHTPQGGGVFTDEDKKCRKTILFRIEGSDADGLNTAYVDIEAIVQASFLGTQWRGPYHGNQPSETILQLAKDFLGMGETYNTVHEKNARESEVNVPNRECIKLETKYPLKRKFNNNPEKNKCRTKKDHSKRDMLPVNNIDESLLPEEPGVGGKPLNVPKARLKALMQGKAYKEAVTRTDDPVMLYLPILIPKLFQTERGLTNAWQGMKTKNIWKDGKIKLPGANQDTAGSKFEDKPHLMLDPYSTAINHGPDGMSVEFNKPPEIEGDRPASPDPIGALGGP